MRKLPVALVLGLVFLMSSVSAQLKVPKSFKVLDAPIALAKKMNVVDNDNDKKFGVVSWEFFKLTPTFQLKVNDKLTLKGQMKFFDLVGRNIINFYDAKGVKKGRLVEEFFEGMFTPTKTVYTLHWEGKIIAKSDKMSVLKTSLTLNSPTTGKVFVKMERPYINTYVWGDKWMVELKPGNEVPVEVIPMIIAFKSYADEKREEAEEEEDEDEEESSW